MHDRADNIDIVLSVKSLQQFTGFLNWPGPSPSVPNKSDIIFVAQ